MKSLLLGTSLAVGMAMAGGSAFASDLPRGVVAAPAPAAASGAYVSVFGGVSFGSHVTGDYTGINWSPDFPLDTGYIVGVAVGTHLTSSLRGEIELSYAGHGATGTSIAHNSTGNTFTEPDSGSFNSLYLLGNLWYDIDTGGSITPYLGGGIGLAVLMPNLTSGSWSYNTDLTAFAGQLGAGFKVQLADNMTLDVGYRVKGIFGGTLTATTGSDISSVRSIDQTVQAGLTIGF